MNRICAYSLYQCKLKEGEMEMPKNPLSDPNQMEAMMEQAKKSMVMMIPQTVIMGWINYFFTGFVLSEWSLDYRRSEFQALTFFTSQSGCRSH